MGDKSNGSFVKAKAPLGSGFSQRSDTGETKEGHVWVEAVGSTPGYWVRESSPDSQNTVAVFDEQNGTGRSSVKRSKVLGWPTIEQASY